MEEVFKGAFPPGLSKGLILIGQGMLRNIAPSLGMVCFHTALYSNDCLFGVVLLVMPSDQEEYRAH